MSYRLTVGIVAELHQLERLRGFDFERLIDWVQRVYENAEQTREQCRAIIAEEREAQAEAKAQAEARTPEALESRIAELEAMLSDR